MQHISFGHIESFDVIFNYIVTHPEKFPENIHLTGTVKIHGTNCSVCDDGTERWFQSRKQIITRETDRFLCFAKERNSVFDEIFASIRKKHPDGTAVLYGEFFGQGIQKNVAVCQLPNAYALFAAKIFFENKDSFWLPVDTLKSFSHPESRIYTVYDFSTFDIDVDLKNWEKAKDNMYALAQSVEDDCPVGRALGATGRGEGIVWQHLATESEPYVIRLKTKGRMFEATDRYNAGQMKGHEHKSQQPKKPQVDFRIMQEQIDIFLDAVLTDARIDQGLSENHDLAAFQKWLVADIMREERVTIAEKKFVPGPLVSAIRKRAENIFQNGAQ